MGMVGSKRGARSPALDGAGDEADGHLLLQDDEEHDDRQDGDQGARRQRGDVDGTAAGEGLQGGGGPPVAAAR
ncbi:MAG: hypothetical protein AVDCRST_MAG48-652 [uncultured Friedmanniella sp.]|uniref:Uncharacterized protein n=1 Tax=uncultured Friedmanniella sp. TaxID=335381 RepID=A0A6J4K0D2_9ACTN|nr:MAG: hypothetical protein AVDCRST_MAG48-652 [uncultured Friedmanniella sp.]